MQYLPIANSGQYVSGIYIVESDSGKVYIGSATKIKTRYMTHICFLRKVLHDNGRLQNYFNKYGEGSLTFRTLEVCAIPDLIKREQFYIDSLNPFFNILRVAGASYGQKYWLGRKHTEETKRKISESNIHTYSKKVKKPKRIKLTKQQNIERFANLNKTAEARKRCSDLHKGNTHWLGKKHKPETIANRMGSLNGNSKRVYCKELDKWFETCKEAYLFFGIGRSAITNSIKKGWKIRGKYTMSYAQD